MKLTKMIYEITMKKSFYNDSSLRDQIRRAIVSVSSNIAEGFEKSNNNEFIRFLKISKGSVGEVRNQLYIAQLLEYINQEEFTSLNIELENLAKQVGSFTNYLSNIRKSGEFKTK